MMLILATALEGFRRSRMSTPDATSGRCDIVFEVSDLPLPFVEFLEGMSSERGIACRVADSSWRSADCISQRRPRPGSLAAQADVQGKEAAVYSDSGVIR